MSNHENHESGSFSLFTLAAGAISICGVAAIVLLMPAQATSEASAAGARTYTAAGDAPGYLPAQYVNQAREIEPMPDTF